MQLMKKQLRKLYHEIKLLLETPPNLLYKFNEVTLFTDSHSLRAIFC